MGWKSGEQKSTYMRQRYENGLCCECSAAREPNRSRCALHLKLSSEEQQRRYAANPDKCRKFARDYARRRRQDPAVRAQLNARLRERYRNNPDLVRRYELQKHYGITIAEYDALVAKQSGMCALCGKPPLIGKRAAGQEKRPPRLCVDHDHKTGKVRGLLCHWCNSHIIAGIEKSGASLERVAKYLGITLES
jgi:hypothetical protein